MKIIHFVPAYLPKKGGIEILVSSLISKFEKYGLKNLVISDSSKGTRNNYNIFNTNVEQFPFSYSFYKKPFNASYLNRIQIELNKTIETFNPDMIHLHGATFISGLFALRSLTKYKNIKYIVTQHGTIEKEDPIEIYRELIYKANNVSAVSNAVANSIKFNIPNLRKEVKVISNGVKLDVSRKVIWPESKGLKILQIGRLDIEKGFDIGIQAVEILCKTMDVSLLIIGEGKREDELRDLANGLKYFNIQNLDNSETQAYVREADFVWITSRTREGFSLVAAEAALNGTPVICSNVGGLSETVINGTSGYICEENSAEEFAQLTNKYIENYFENYRITEKQKNIIKNSTRLRFDLDECASNYLNLYKESLYK